MGKALCTASNGTIAEETTRASWAVVVRRRCLSYPVSPASTRIVCDGPRTAREYCRRE